MVTKLFKNWNSGQSLLEVTISLGLLTVALTALTILTINGLKNSQFSKNQAQATKLAQEAIEKIRTFRDSNLVVCDVPRGLDEWEDLWPNGVCVSDINSPDVCRYEFRYNEACSGGAVTPLMLMSTTTGESISNGQFERTIYITPESSQQKRVTVRVSWSDSSGIHFAELSTIIARI